MYASNSSGSVGNSVQNRTARVHPAEQPVETSVQPNPITLFEQTALKQGDSVAVTYGETSTSYKTLNNQANRLAKTLLAQDCRGKVCILFVKPNVDMVISLLGIMKAGAIYTPVDPDFPAGRIQYLLEKLDPAIILTDSNNLALLPEEFRDRAAFISESLTSTDSDAEPENPDAPLNNSDPAYIFFTSGTTGNPKGVVGSCGNLKHYVASAIYELGLNNRTRLISVAKFTFSINLLELLVPLCVGGHITLLSRSEVLDPNKLIQTIKGANTFHFTPNLLRTLFREFKQRDLSAKDFEHIIHVSSGGDLIPVEVVNEIGNYFPNAEVFTVYGCSEVAVMGCRYPVLAPKTLPQTVVGTPFAGADMRILDENLNPVAANDKGEIYFSGNGITLGYWQDEKQTAERYKIIDGERWYGTGDIGRLDPSGNLQILGREDFQININGIRIELAEIEAQLRKAPHITDAVTMSFKDDSGTHRIYGFLVGEFNAGQVAEIRQYLTTQMPDYMQPVGFVSIDKLPLNHNLKVDRKALAAPTQSQLIREEEFVAAESDIEATLLQLWQEALESTEIGVNDNFFNLGGDSIRAATLVSRIQKELNVTLPIQAFLQRPTIRSLAELLANADQALKLSNVFMLKGGSALPLFCFYGVLLYRELAQALPDYTPVFGVFLQEEVELLATGDLNVVLKTLADVQTIAQKYLVEVRSIQPKGPYYLCGESFGGMVALEAARILMAEGEEVKFIGMFDTWTPNYGHKSILHQLVSIGRTAILRPDLLIKKVYSKIDRKGVPPEAGIDANNNGDDIAAKARRIIIRRYVPDPFHEPVVLYRAKDRSPLEPIGKDLGWRRFLSNLKIKTTPGNHLGILKQPNVQTLANDLATYLPKDNPHIPN
ncbi:AMP-binding protein [Halioxenophilus sp. WMMB6]|uniref:AMP-binding protein n=1 Tax=Halioxenophilus sp. WMMB6 TaxID=3073815 RepID=UPI00295F112B|nr:AMP-binding protein [Halioxenophilus sp. WMMB6]